MDFFSWLSVKEPAKKSSDSSGNNQSSQRPEKKVPKEQKESNQCKREIVEKPTEKRILNQFATMEITSEVTYVVQNVTKKDSWSDDWSSSSHEDEIPEPFFTPLAPPRPIPYRFPPQIGIRRTKQIKTDYSDEMEKGILNVPVQRCLFDSDDQTIEKLETHDRDLISEWETQPYRDVNYPEWKSNPLHDSSLPDGADHENDSSSEEYIFPPTKLNDTQTEIPIYDSERCRVCNSKDHSPLLCPLLWPTDVSEIKQEISKDHLLNNFQIPDDWSQFKIPLLSATDKSDLQIMDIIEELKPNETNESVTIANAWTSDWVPTWETNENEEKANYSENTASTESEQESEHYSDEETSEYEWNKQTEGSLKLYIGPMFSGKSTAIIFELARMADIGFDTLYINHADDNRSTEAQDTVVSTHNSQYTNLSRKINSMKVSTLSDIDVRDYNYIAIDEGQFFPDLYKSVIIWVTAYGKNVLVASLDGDAFRRKFGQVLDLIPHADKVKKLKAICDICLTNERKARPAPFTARFGDNKEAKVIGGPEKYKAVCRSCHDKHLEKSN